MGAGLYLPQAHPRVRLLCLSCTRSPARLFLTPKPVCPSERERMLNPRAGSAKLRVAEKLDPHVHQTDEESGEEAARLRYEAKRAARLARHGREGRERA